MRVFHGFGGSSPGSHGTSQYTAALARARAPFPDATGVERKDRLYRVAQGETLLEYRAGMAR